MTKKQQNKIYRAYIEKLESENLKLTEENKYIKSFMPDNNRLVSAEKTLANYNERLQEVEKIKQEYSKLITIVLSEQQKYKKEVKDLLKKLKKETK